jgi:hypothetical protein
MSEAHIGAYAVECVPRNYRVWAEKKDHVTKETYKVPFWKTELQFNLTHTSGDEVCFKYHLHAGKWIWHDSRVGGVTQDAVVSEMARMLFHGSKVAAETYVSICLSNQGLE